MGLFSKKKNANYISGKEARRISKENRKITDEIEKQRKRKHIPEEEYITKMKDDNNVVEFDNVQTSKLLHGCRSFKSSGRSQL